MQQTNKEFKETRAMFNVPGVIGLVGKEGSGPEFFSYEEFVVGMYRRNIRHDEYQ